MKRRRRCCRSRCAADFGAVYVQVGLLVHAADTPDADPMQLPRLTAQADVRVLEERDRRLATDAARFIGRFPGADVTLNLGDFEFYELTLGRGRSVEGFARAFNVGSHTFQEIARLDLTSRHA